MANDDRLHGDDIFAECDFPDCTRCVERDVVHTCRFCGRYYCDGHILLADGGAVCRQCYERNWKQIDEE